MVDGMGHRLPAPDMGINACLPNYIINNNTRLAKESDRADATPSSITGIGS